ncbi:MAG: hypothetical protein WC521_01930 [Bdellovibrionales bacterium]
MSNPRDTLVLLVTCSRDETRRDLAVEVTKNMAELVPAAGLQDSFMLFDNASTFADHLSFAPKGAVVVQSPENIGYWSAIKWVLEHHREYFVRTFKYIYLVESDLTHSDLRPLGLCENFLDATPSASCVRTQEFSVRHRWRYNKDLRFMPFRNLRSVVRQRNEVTGEKAWFIPPVDGGKIWRSNLHAKLPALNRIETLCHVFSELEALGEFSERDFFDFTYRDKKDIGIYDGGLFHQLSTPQTTKIMSGSWSDVLSLKKMGYQTTRQARFLEIENQPTVSRK